MGLLHKLGITLGAGASSSQENTRHLPASTRPRTGGVAVGPASSHRTPEPHESTRISNGLKEFLWNLDGLGRGSLLDLGPAWQTTLSFFIERGFRVSSEDILRGWTTFLAQEERRLKDLGPAADPEDWTPAGRAGRFLKENLQYPVSSFDAVLMWDLLDYLEPTLVKQTVAHVTELLRPGAVVFAMFHSKKPDGFRRYRVLDSNSLQVVSAPSLSPAQKVYQNREIQDLFGRYRTTKSFVGRDQLRETLFIK
jgi:hypothetical protein